MNLSPLLPKTVDKTIDIDSLIISSLTCIVIILGFISYSEQFLHWFILPVTLGGILIGIDAVDWFRGRLNLFDPVGILGLLGFHFFFLAPLLHVHWEIWLVYVTPPPDWRPWLGEMAILNFLGLLIYRFVRELPWKSNHSDITIKHQRKTIWRLAQRRFFPILLFSLAVSAVLQVMIYRMFGGIMGYIAAASVEEQSTSMVGMGWLFMLSENFPILAMMGFAVYSKNNKKLQSWRVLIVVILLFLALQLLFGGLRGSRSNTIWALFWAVGILHFWIRPVSRKIISVGLLFLIIFMYLYGFYKSAGLDAFSNLQEPDALVSLEDETGRSWKSLVLQDLGRSDIQAFVLYRIVRPESDYQLAWGRTYLGTAALLIPGSIWPNRPLTKLKEGTDVQFGMGSYTPDSWVASNVYGLAGESMLNFGPWAVPFFFIPFALIVRLVRHWLLTWTTDDTRVAILPMLINLCFVVLVSDTDNTLFFIIKSGTVPFVVMWLVSNRQAIDASAIHTRSL